jgi:hypothetical protein
MEAAAPTVIVVWLPDGNKETFYCSGTALYWAIKIVEENIHNLLNIRLANGILRRQNVINEQNS